MVYAALRLGWFLLIVLVLLGAAARPAMAAVSPEISKGAAWLQGQIGADGTLAQPALPQATSIQAETEAVTALAALGLAPSIPAGLLDRLSQLATPTQETESLARAALALKAAAGDSSRSMDVLSARQNADGGWGVDAGSTSTSIDTLWGCYALSAHTAQGAPAAAAWLLAVQDQDGGMRGASAGQRIQDTALAIAALQPAISDFQIQSAVLRMGTWLGNAAGVDGSWRGSIYLTAMGLHALTLQATHASVRAQAQQWLLARQSSDGSWEGDPFLTAVVLRALATVPPEQPRAGSISGQVLDAPQGAGIAGVQVELAGALPQVKVTDGNGRFIFSDLSAGNYTVRIGSAPYTPIQLNVAVAQGQDVDLGSISLASAGPVQTTGAIQGQVTALATGAPIAGAQLAVSGAVSLTAQTDADGRYQFLGIPPGPLSLEVSSAGYHAATASATMAAGMVLNFSPALIDATQPAPQPAQSRLVGSVVSDQGLPLGSVAIRLDGGDAGASDAAGAFDIPMAPGAYHLELVLAGYDRASADIVVPSASIMQLGTVVLHAERTVSEIFGTVTSEDTGAPLAGAEVALQGGPATTADASGAYRLEGLSGKAFNLLVSATGHVAQSWRIETEVPAAIRKDFALASMGSGGAIAFTDMAVSSHAVGPDTLVTVTAKVENHATEARDVVLQMLVIDASGQAVDLAPARDVPAAQLLGAFTLGAGQAQSAQFVWNSGQFPAGAYSLAARAVQAGSMTRATPSGQVLATRSAAITVTAAARFAGTVVANPPVLRANAGTPVKLQVFIRSTGNVALPAQPYELAITDEATHETLATLQAFAPALPPGATATITFADWLPTRPGSFALAVTAPADASLGQANGKLYAGDTAMGSYTVNQNQVPTGTQGVRASIKIVGEDSATGGLANPMAATIKAAIQKSVAYGDLQASNWTASNQCLGCHVQSQALVGGELSRGLTNQSDTQRNALYNALAIYRQSNGALRDDNNPGYVKAQNLLALWALNAWHKKAEIGNTLAASAEYARSVQDADGGWTTDYAGGWWTARASQTAFNVKNLVDVADLLQAAPAPTSYQPQVLAEGAGLSGTYYLHAAAGRLLVSNNSSGTVVQWSAAGVQQTLATGLYLPEGLATGTDGTVYVATASGIYAVPASGGTPQRLGTLGAANGLLIAPDGSLYASHYASSTIYRIDASGNATLYWSGTPLRGPVGMAFDEDGRLVVLNYTARTIVRLNADKTYDTPVSLLYGNPRSLARRGSDWIVGTTNGAYRFNAEWQGERLSFEAAQGVAVDESGTIYTSNGAQRVSRLVPQAVDAAAQIAANDAAALRGMQWLMSGTNGINATSNLELAHQLIGLGSAYGRYAGQPATSEVHDKMVALADLLKSRQRADGGWGLYTSYGSDSMVTAQVGYALDYVNPSPDDPYILKAVQYLLSRQQADGSWMSENGIFTTRHGATSWVEIWLPVALERVGGIDTALHLRFAPDVHMSNPTLAPAQTAVQADGSTDYTWELLGVTTRTRQIDFDLTLQDMLPGETRPASTQAQLVFRNSFIGDTVTTSVDVPAVHASAGIGITVGTDRVVYPAHAPVSISAEVASTSSVAQSGSVAFSILAPDGVPVIDLGPTPFHGLAPMASATVPSAWDTGTMLAGRYSVQARLFDAAGHLAGTATAAFDIVAGPPGASAITAQVRTDKQRYQVGSTVQITSRAVNTAPNQAWNDLVAETGVYTPTGALLWSTATPIASLAPSGQAELGYSVPLGTAAAGGYTVRLTVRDAQGAPLASDQTAFSVQSSAAGPISGAGLRGTLTPTAATAQAGQAVPVAFAITNMGNADLVNSTVRVRVLQPGGGSVLETFMQTGVDLPMGQTLQFQWNWVARGAQGLVFPLAASVEHQGAEQTLAQGAITLVTPATPHPIPLKWSWLLSVLLPALAWARRRKPNPAALAQ